MTTTADRSDTPTVHERERQIRHLVEWVADAPPSSAGSCELALHVVLAHALGLPGVPIDTAGELISSYRGVLDADRPDREWTADRDRYDNAAYTLACEAVEAARTAEVLAFPRCVTS